MPAGTTGIYTSAVVFNEQRVKRFKRFCWNVLIVRMTDRLVRAGTVISFRCSPAAMGGIEETEESPRFRIVPAKPKDAQSAKMAGSDAVRQRRSDRGNDGIDHGRQRRLIVTKRRRCRSTDQLARG